LIVGQGIRNPILLVRVMAGFTLMTGAFHGKTKECWTIPAGNLGALNATRS